MSENHADVSGENNPMYGMRGDLSPMYGKTQSPETREKLSKAPKGKESWCKGKKRPEQSKRMQGKGNPMHGELHSVEIKEKMSILRKARLCAKGGHKLTWEIVKEMRQRHAQGDITITALAKQYNLSRTYCNRVILNHHWREE